MSLFLDFCQNKYLASREPRRAPAPGASKYHLRERIVFHVSFVFFVFYLLYIFILSTKNGILSAQLIFGSHRVKFGIKVTSTRITIAIARNGKIALKVPPIEVFPIFVPTSRDTPTGGVMQPR